MLCLNKESFEYTKTFLDFFRKVLNNKRKRRREMKTVIKNATLISISEKREKIEEKVDIEIENTQITKIEKNIPIDGADKIIDATGKIVMPGLINTHAHVPMSIFRETVDGYSLQEWLTQKIWPMEDKLTEEDIYDASLLSFIEMIKTGTTTINDMYFMTEDIIKAAKKAKIRLQTSRTLMGQDDEAGNKRIEELEALLEKEAGKDELITFNVGVHGLYTSSREYVNKCANYAQKKGLPIHIHFCENTKEVEDIKQNYQTSPTEVLKQELSNVKLILAHSVKVDEKEIEELKKLNVSISHCPISNLKLGCGVANITEMLKQGINVTIGTDGQGSGSNLDLFEQMKYTALLQKGIQEDATVLPAYEVLKMATINGAKALGLEEKIGSIEEGKKADIILLDLNEAVTNPINDIYSDIVYNAKGTNVVTTIINGRVVMENRKIEQEENQIYEKCKKIIDRIKA